MQQENKIVFDINKLYCGYNNADAVLYIENLQIPANKIVFILGLSGIGKSTFVETLGLMNNTILNQDAKLDFISKDNKVVNLSNLWTLDDSKQSNFREKYLSFIFQNTNLMPNMTAGENICINLLFEGYSMREAKKKVLEQFKKLNLEDEKFDYDITALSGGERQRIAFVRGLIAHHEVLLGDEPTGNLDKKTANSAMQGIKDALLDQQKSSIIVTHDPELAVNFGDSIILITPKYLENGNKMGIIDNSNLYFKTNAKWFDYNNNAIPNLKEKIYNILSFR